MLSQEGVDEQTDYIFDETQDFIENHVDNDTIDDDGKGKSK